MIKTHIFKTVIQLIYSFLSNRTTDRKKGHSRITWSRDISSSSAISACGLTHHPTISLSLPLCICLKILQFEQERHPLRCLPSVRGNWSKVLRKSGSVSLEMSIAVSLRIRTLVSWASVESYGTKSTTKFGRQRSNFWSAYRNGMISMSSRSVSYTHLTLPTNREV